MTFDWASVLFEQVSKSADAPKDGSNKKSPVQAVPPTLPKSTFTDIFGQPDVARKPKKKSIEKASFVYTA